MRTLLYLLVLTPLLAQTQNTLQANNEIHTIKEIGGIQWVEKLSWSQIKARALVENKFIFIDAYATWCGPCKRMNKEVFSDKTVIDFLNKEFISVKAQMDETKYDDEKVKAWYNDARYIKENYKPDGYPCFLFFTPNGALAHKEKGFQNSQKFIAIAKEALTNPIEHYNSQKEKFNKGQLDIASLPNFARLAKKKRENDLANQIARLYKDKYLNHLSDKEAYTKENLLFVTEFAFALLNSKDRYFHYFYNNGKESDSLMDYKVKGKLQPISARVVSMVIKEEEIIVKLYKDGKPITDHKPQWEEIRGFISKKYGETYSRMYFPDEQIDYYNASCNWKNYVKYVNQKIDLLKPKANGHLFGGQLGDSWSLNCYAWDLFKLCTNKKHLKEALQWINMAIVLSKNESKDSIPNIQYLDTKANLMYKLGNKKEAISLERRVISLLSPGSSLKEIFGEILSKMEKGLPTWRVAEK